MRLTGVIGDSDQEGERTTFEVGADQSFSVECNFERSILSGDGFAALFLCGRKGLCAHPVPIYAAAAILSSGGRQG